ncbi:HNH endonuclease [Caballeronia terrestris]|uniref:HNH endonuclease n=1 Tax=Caballeronia terrestris TaxID=1226301 RepID=A0A158KVS8_9BURK|nr:RNA-guided endonuclease IscB [Caballeronia terrestris]SAL85197.1 HNH endonuclease [Caballeronia terrestris]
MAAFVLDKRGSPLMPCSEKRARLLLKRGRARVHRVLPFVIRLTDRLAEESAFQSLRVKVDPGSKVTGVALVREFNSGIAVLNLFSLMHRGRQISEALVTRRNFRHRRRSANLRYRAPRFLNRARRDAWLAPSLQHRVDTTMSWVRRIKRWTPISATSVEFERYDLQAMRSAEVAGYEHRKYERVDYEIREYLLKKWWHRCAYCDKEGVPLHVGHIISRARGGSDHLTNLTICCGPCHFRKGERDIKEFVVDGIRCNRILGRAKVPLKESASVSSTRAALVTELRSARLVVETSTGGRTKWNRARFGIPKTYALDAVCVGDVSVVMDWQRPTVEVKCSGRGSYQRTRLTAEGFPRSYLIRKKRIYGFQTGDRVRADVSKGKMIGIYVGRVAVRASGNFNIKTQNGVVQGINHRYCKVVQRADGYGYSPLLRLAQRVTRSKSVGPAL